MSRRYTLGAQVVLRMTGFPVELITPLRAVGLAETADGLRAAERELEEHAAALAEALRQLGADGRTTRRRVERRKAVTPTDGVEPALFRRYADALAHRDRLAASLPVHHAQALEAARRHLYRVVTDERFHQMLLLSSPELLQLTPTEVPDPLPPRNQHVRGREVTWASYLQRITTKNETVSTFGPSVWGRVDDELPRPIDLVLGEGIDARKVYLERWVAEVLAARMTADPEVRPLLRPRLADDAELEGGRARLWRAGTEVELTAAEREVAARCDGLRRVTEVGEIDTIERLVTRGVLALAMWLPANPRPVETLAREVDGWPGSAARDRWASRLAALERLRAQIESTGAVAARRAALEEIGAVLVEAGYEAKRRPQTLYTSRLPIGESCRRRVERFAVGRPIIEQATEDLAPWYELWRDVAGLYAQRIFEALQGVWRSLGGAPVCLPRFLAACAAAKVPFEKEGGVLMAAELHGELQQAWQDQLGSRMDQREVALTADDLAFVRRRWSPRRMKGFDVPSPDLQIVASSRAALDAGQWSLLLGEIHPDLVTWEGATFVHCPDVARQVDEYRRGAHPTAVIFGARHQNEHTDLHTYAHTGGWSFVGGDGFAGAPNYRSAEVMVELTPDDALLVHRGRVLGSLVHTWSVAYHTHGLQLLGTGAHTPRLRVGRVVVQRETWLVEPARVLGAAPLGEAEAFAALRRLRAQHDLPEEVFIWPVLPLRNSLYKDAKPMYVDFRNVLLAEILDKLARRFRALRIAEMIPTTGECWLDDDEGHYSCELRMNTLLPAG